MTPQEKMSPEEMQRFEKETLQHGETQPAEDGPASESELALDSKRGDDLAARAPIANPD